MESFFLSYISYWKPLAYFFVFLGMILEGDMVLFTVSFLAFTGLLNWILVLFTVLSGIWIGDLFWYWIGTHLKGSNNFLARWVHRITTPFDQHIAKRPFKTILISKFAYGIHHAILIRAGALGIPVKKYIRIEIVSSLLWITIIGGLAYFSKQSFDHVRHTLHKAELSLLFGVIVFFIFWKIMSKLIRKGL